MAWQVKASAAKPDDLHFHLWSPHGRRRVLTSKSCSISYTTTPWARQWHTQILTYTHKNVS